ncbi:DUF881 domain-containing protein [Propionibacteriaceae bacterium Y1700]|uniref:DUF881 domain-containing protein n=1 Tax=Microlunatus sp. Y1700 TaxID=3418487 RepID=UPI003DA798DB
MPESHSDHRPRRAAPGDDRGRPGRAARREAVEEVRESSESRRRRRPGSGRTASGRSGSTSRRLRRAAARAERDAVPTLAGQPAHVEGTPRTEPGRPAARRGATSSARRAGGPQERAARARRRILALLVKPARGQLVAALALCLVGFGVVTQVRSQQSDEDYSTARREDLVQLLDGLNQETRRLESEVADLQQTRENLQSGADADRVAREEARRRADALGILAGTKRAQGPGIRMVITDPHRKVTAGILLDAIEEMRDAGAEVIEVNDSIRVVSSSWIGTSQQGLLIDDQLVTTPITIEVIGDSHSLAEGARFRGGLVSEITAPGVGGEVQLTTHEVITVDSLHTPKPNQYAQPASEGPG